MWKLSEKTDPDARKHPLRTRLYRKAVLALQSGDSLDALLYGPDRGGSFERSIRKTALDGVSLDALVSRGDFAHPICKIEGKPAPSVEDEEVQCDTKTIDE